MSVQKTVRFIGQSSVPTIHTPVTKSPSKPRSILSPKHRHRDSPSPEPIQESVEPSDDEVFLQISGKEEKNETYVKKQTQDITLIGDINESYYTTDTKFDAPTGPIVKEPVNTQLSSSKATNTKTVYSCASVPQTRTSKQISTPFRKDFSRGQFYSVSSPRGCESCVEVRYYKLKKDNSEHREKVNKCKFDKLTARFNSELEKAHTDLGKRQKQSSNVVSKSDCFSVKASSWDIYPEHCENLSQSQINFSNNNNLTEESQQQNPTSFKEINHNQQFSQESSNQHKLINMSESIFASPRLHEKQELQTLNARLSQYIRHIREMKENAGYLDSQVFLESVTVLEEELVKLKNLYNRELDDLRIKLDDITRSRNHFELEEKKAKSLASELKNRLQIETEKNHKQHVEIQSLQRMIAQKDMQIEEGRIALQTPYQELDTLQREFDKMLREHEELKKRFDKEQLARQDAEDRSDTMKKKLDFQATMNEQEKAEMTERLNSANATILSMEAKIREVSHHDQTLVEMLKRVRESSEEQLRQYQEESEERHMRHLTELKAQIDEDDRRITELTEETLKLNGDITNLYGRIRELEGQNGSLEHQKTCLIEQLNGEKRRAENHMKKMEIKLRELQEVLINKMRELNAAREAQIPLKAEIESFRAMIEEEERRLRISSGDFPELPVIPQYNTATASSRKEMHTTTTGPVFMPRSEGYGVKPVLSNSRTHEEVKPLPRPLGPIRTKSAPASAIRKHHQQQLNLVPTNIGQGKDYFDDMFKDLKLSDSQRDEESSVSLNMSRSSSNHSKTQIIKQTLEPIDRAETPQQSSKHVQILQVHDDSRASPMIVPNPPAVARYQPPSMQDTQMSQMNDSVRGCATYDDLHTSSCISGNWVRKQIIDQKEEIKDQFPYSSGAVGDIKIFEVHPEGKYIRLLNTSQKGDEEFGGYLLQQNVGGYPVAVYRFPSRIRFGPGETVTVWSGANDYSLHNPPSDYVFKEQQKWGTGAECTTILCKPNGQAVAWTRAAHRVQKDYYADNSSHNLQSPSPVEMLEEEEGNTNNNHNEMTTRDEQLSEYNMNINGNQAEPVYLRREKEAPPSLAQPKHPHGAPYAGASAQRMGSASLRRYQGSGAIANKAGVHPGTETSQPPNSFQKPSDCFRTGLEQIQSQHHTDFQPPMPRPPLFSTW